MLSSLKYKKPMGHISKLKNQFALINYDHTITLISVKKKPLSPCSLCVKIWILFTQGCFVPSLVDIGPVVLGKIFKFHLSIFVIFLLSLPGKGCSPSFEQTCIPFTKGSFVSVLFVSGPVVLEKQMKMWKVYNDNRKAPLSLPLRGSFNLCQLFENQVVKVSKKGWHSLKYCVNMVIICVNMVIFCINKRLTICLIKKT